MSRPVVTTDSVSSAMFHINDAMKVDNNYADLSDQLGVFRYSQCRCFTWCSSCCAVHHSWAEMCPHVEWDFFEHRPLQFWLITFPSEFVNLSYIFVGESPFCGENRPCCRTSPFVRWFLNAVLNPKLHSLKACFSSSCLNCSPYFARTKIFSTVVLRITVY